MSAFLKFSGTGLLIFGVAALGYALMYFAQERQMLRTWPRAEATVIDAQVVEHKTAQGPLYGTELRFAFAADGQPVTGTYVFPHESTSRQRKQRQAAQYPIGSRHTIIYDPSNPVRVHIRAGYNVEFFVIPVFLAGVAGIFGLAGAGLWAGAKCAEKRALRAAA